MSANELHMRLRVLEDERDIGKLVASYGPAVDAGDADRAADLWKQDGAYDVEGWSMASRQSIHDMVSSDSHQALVARGCCHFLGPAVITVDGDQAIAVCESLVLLRRGETAGSDSADQYGVWRATANHFELSRVNDQWCITTRTSRLLDGGTFAHALLTAGLAGVVAPIGGRGEGLQDRDADCRIDDRSS